MKSTGEEDFSSKLLKKETKSCLRQKKNLNVRFGSINSTPQQDSHTSLLLQICLLSVFSHMSATHCQGFKEVGCMIITFLEIFIILSKYRAVTKISSCRVSKKKYNKLAGNQTSWRFLLVVFFLNFPAKVARGDLRPLPLNDSPENSSPFLIGSNLRLIVILHN